MNGQNSVAELVRFSKPPIVEVGCGIQFNPLPLQTVHYGLFWRQFRERYSQALDAPPWPQALEAQPGNEYSNKFAARLSPMPEQRRVLYINPEKGQLLQVQDNRLHHNWQKHGENDIYPRFQEVLTSFLEQWKRFVLFLSDENIPPPHPLQYQISYANFIPEGALWTDAAHQDVFSWLGSPESVELDAPELEFGLRYWIPECRGRLHVALRNAQRTHDKKKGVSLELTVRGAPQKTGRYDDLEDWLLAARSVIVRNFTALTSPKAHQYWGREK